MVQRARGLEVISGRAETRAAKVALVSGLSMFLSLALQFLSVPVCLRYWGAETYGLWLALFALCNVLRTLDAGYSSYVGNELNILYHRDQAALRRTLASGLAGSIVVGVLQLVAGIAIVSSGSLAELLGVAPEVVRAQRAGLALGVLIVGWVLTGTYLGIVHRLQVPAGLLHQATWWLMGYQITQALALVSAAALRLDISGAAVLISLAQVVVYLATAVYVARKLPEFFPWWRRPSWAVALRDLYRSTVMVGANVLIQLSTSGLVMLVSASLGAAVVPAFTTVRTVAGLWTMLGNALISPLLPEMVRYHAHRDGGKLVAALEAYWLIATSAVNLSVLILFPFLGELYRHWTGGGVVLEDSLLGYMLLSVVLGMPAMLITNYLLGINELRAVTAIFGARGVVPLVASALLLPSVGIDGVGIAVVLGEVAGPLCLGLPLFRRHLRAFDPAAGTSAWRPVVAGSSATALFLLAHAIHAPHAREIYALALVGAIASAVWSWARVGPDVRERSLGLLRRSVP